MEAISQGGLAEQGPVIYDANGLPIIRLPAEWTGLVVQRFVLPARAESGPVSSGVPVLFSSTSGSGKRRYKSGAYTQDLMTGPFVDTYESTYERDRAEWNGTTGESVGIRITPTAAATYLGEDARKFDLVTRYNVRDEQLRRLIRDFALEMEAGLPNGRTYADGLSLAIIGWLGRHYTASHQSTVRLRRFADTEKRRLCDFIDANLGHDIGLVPLAALVRLSPSHFSSVFRATFGLPPHKFLVMRRIAMAAAELRRSHDRPLADVALQFGFASQSHFTQSFRRETGMTPAAWRRR